MGFLLGLTTLGLWILVVVIAVLVSIIGSIFLSTYIKLCFHKSKEVELTPDELMKFRRVKKGVTNIASIITLILVCMVIFRSCASIVS